MGITLSEVVFDGAAPSAAEIAQRMEELIGLPVTVDGLSPVIRDTLHDLHAHLAFTALPRERIQISAYRPGAVKDHLERTGVIDMPIAPHVQGMNEAAGTQTVYVQGYVGQEVTLTIATLLALEQLSGRLTEPLPDELRAEYGRRITANEFARRGRKIRNRNLLQLSFGVLTLPIWLPIQLLSIGWHIVTIPCRIAKARKIVANYPTRR